MNITISAALFGEKVDVSYYIGTPDNFCEGTYSLKYPIDSDEVLRMALRLSGGFNEYKSAISSKLQAVLARFIGIESSASIA